VDTEITTVAGLIEYIKSGKQPEFVVNKGYEIIG